MPSKLTETINSLDHCLILVRHGQTQWNAEDRLTTFTDIPLTELGKEQPAELAEALAPVRFDYISSSPLQRAKNTAKITCALMIDAPEIKLDERLVEPSAGSFEGTTFKELRSGGLAQAWNDYQREVNPVFFNGVETVDQSVSRAESLLVEVSLNPGRHLMFSHGAFIRIIAQVANGGDPNCYRRLKIDNCSVAIFKFFPDPPHQMVAWNLVP